MTWDARFRQSEEWIVRMALAKGADGMETFLQRIDTHPTRADVVSVLHQCKAYACRVSGMAAHHFELSDPAAGG